METKRKWWQTVINYQDEEIARLRERIVELEGRPGNRPVVYISGPISRGNWADNFHQFCAMQTYLMERGFAVINPGLSMMLPGHHKISHEAWMKNDLPLVERSHAVMRMPGESVGGDLETAHADKCQVPVFHSVVALEDWKDTVWKVKRLSAKPGSGKATSRPA